LGATTPTVVVVDLGTNDVVKGVPTATSLAAIDNVIANFPSSCVVVVNVNEQTTAGGYNTAAAHAFNQGLVDRGLRIADWTCALTGHLTAYAASPAQVMPSAGGQTALAGLVSGTVHTCFGSGE